jgi:hypothetical protein
MKLFAHLFASRNPARELSLIGHEKRRSPALAASTWAWSGTGGFKTVAVAELDPYASKVLAKRGISRRSERGRRDHCGVSRCRHHLRGLSVPGHQLCRGRRRTCRSPFGTLAGSGSSHSRGSTAIRDPGERGSAAWSRAGTVLGDLAEIGHDAEWHCIPASAVGAPHRRDRIWIIAHPGGEQHEGRSAPLSGRSPRNFLAPLLRRQSLYILPENKKKPGPSAEGTQRRIASIRRAITSRAMERIKQGLSAESANDAPTRFAQRELEQQLQDTARQLDPIEQALTKVRRTRIVFRASVYGGPHNRFYISGRDRETISEQELLKLARKVA